MAKIFKSENIRESFEGESFKDYCKNYILDNIEDFEGQSVYGSDLGYDLTETANVNGSITMNKQEASEYIKHWWNDAGAFYDYYKNELGDEPDNPFDNPEGFMVQMVIMGVNSILAQCDIIRDNWNDDFELTPEVISEIEKEVADFNGEIF